jgi:hypothetical protein
MVDQAREPGLPYAGYPWQIFVRAHYPDTIL